VAQSPLKSGGKEGLRASFFRPAEEVGIDGVGDPQVGRVGRGSCAFWACVGPSLVRTSCRSWWVALC